MGTPLSHEDREFQPARLIPATGIRGPKEQEERSTSALLAVMQVVPSFGRRVLSYLGAPAGRISAFIEPRFETDDGGTAIPDGLVIVERGQKRWAGLVEVKTGRSTLDGAQINRYLSIVHREGFDAMLTISNEIVADPSESPVRIDGRRLKKTRLAHLSWFRILTEAVIELEHRGVEDVEQRWILGELIAYLDDHRSGTGTYEGMGKEWVDVRKAARQHTLRPTDPAVRVVAADWEEFMEYMSLRLRQSLGRKVAPAYPRGSSRQARLDSYVRSLGTGGMLEATIRVPDTVAPIQIEADVGSLQVTTRVRVAAPKTGRPKTRITWLLRQLKDASSEVRIGAHFHRTRETTSQMIAAVRSDPKILLLPDDRKREPVAFDIATTRSMGVKRGRGRGSFAYETMRQVLDFYGDVLQNLRKWNPPAPRLQEETPTADGDGEAATGASVDAGVLPARHASRVEPTELGQEPHGPRIVEEQRDSATVDE